MASTDRHDNEGWVEDGMTRAVRLRDDMRAQLRKGKSIQVKGKRR